MAFVNPDPILIVDDELEICLSLAELLEARNYQALYSVDPRKALDILEDGRIACLIADVRMPGLGGIELLRRIKEQDPDLPVLMITGYPDFRSAVTAMRYGAANIFTKPIPFQDLLNEIEGILGSREAKKRKEALHPREIPPSHNGAMMRVNENIARVAGTDVPVVVTGESGTGKELAAAYIHHHSPRGKGPFIKVNCAAIPESLLESELFGYEAGAFTGAGQTRIGRFEAAQGGTLFLDEIGDMALTLQAKILRVIQEQEFERLGGTRSIKTDIRFIAATNKDLPEMISRREFRQDLYYRLSVVSLSLPPLRERREDILPLAEYFLGVFNGVYGKEILGFQEDVKGFLLSHNWPGNIRELKNGIERAVIFCDTRELSRADLPKQYRTFPAQPGLEGFDDAIKELDRERILEALRQSGGVKQGAADILRIHRKTLYNKMKQLGLQ